MVEIDRPCMLAEDYIQEFSSNAFDQYDVLCFGQNSTEDLLEVQSYNQPNSCFEPSSSSYSEWFDSKVSADQCHSENYETQGISFRSSDWLVMDTSTKKYRPPKQNEYLYLLLENQDYSSFASWVDRNQGTFKIHEPDRVAALWKLIKNRKTKGTMDYNTFARGIRYYYKSGLMIKTNKKHTFRFKVSSII